MISTILCLKNPGLSNVFQSEILHRRRRKAQADHLNNHAVSFRKGLSLRRELLFIEVVERNVVMANFKD